jgi:hypothetical protein
MWVSVFTNALMKVGDRVDELVDMWVSALHAGDVFDDRVGECVDDCVW